MDFFANFQVELPESMKVGDWKIRDGIAATGITVILLAEAGDAQAWLKVPNRNYLDHPELPPRFAREADILRQLEGPWFPRWIDSGTYQAGTHPTIPYLVTERVDGDTLSEIMARNVKDNHFPTEADATRLMRSLAEALAAVHKVQIVHRNLRPACITLAEDGVHIFDFVLGRSVMSSRVTSEHQHIGSWRYGAPEQIRDAHAVDGRADLFSVGVLAYEYLTQRPPYPSAFKLAHDPPPPEPPSKLNPTITPDFEALLLRLIEPDPTRRPATARALLDTLSQSV